MSHSHSSSQHLKIGFIGLGDQGAPIARRIIDAGYDTTLWARRPESLVPFADIPAHLAAHQAASLAELGARCDVVGVCVRSDADVDQVLRGDGGLLAALRPGSILLIHATVHPELCRQLAAAAAQVGVTLLDAPVSGGNARAASGQMTVMVGGERAAFDAVLPLLQTFANTVEWLGPVGSGQLCKLVNNALFMVNFATALTLLESGSELGLQRPALARLLAAGSGQSFALDTAANINPAGLRHAASLLGKDAALLLDVLHGGGPTSDQTTDQTTDHVTSLAASAGAALADIAARQPQG